MNTKLANPVHFLIVDDLESNLVALEVLLRREGLVVLKAMSGADALELLLKHDVGARRPLTFRCPEWMASSWLN